MSTDKPRICEVLGVEVGEVFSARMESGECRQFVAQGIRLHHVRADGSTGNRANNMSLWLLEHPESIIRKPRFTEDEVADVAAVQRIFRSAVVGRLENGNVYISNRAMSLNEAWSSEDRITFLPERLFPSILPGQSVNIADIIKNENEKES